MSFFLCSKIFQFCCLGDSGYPLEPWLITPYRNPLENSAESYFNEQHSKGRSIIERAFGLLKARFRCLLAARELHYNPVKAALILNACCALHNICLEFNVDSPQLEHEDNMSSNSNMPVAIEEDNNLLNLAKNIRNTIKNNMQRN